MPTTNTLRSIHCYRDEKGYWICELSGEDSLRTFARTPEEALSEILALLEEQQEKEREDDDEEEEWEEDEEEEIQDDRPVGFSLDTGIPSPFGIPWRWILIPALLLTLLTVTWTVRSESTVAVPTPPPVHYHQWSAPPTQDLWREMERERRIRELERRQSICSDPDLPPHLRDWCR
jgi:hypothetical protein